MKLKHILLAILPLLTVAAVAQEERVIVTGTVTDQSSAAISGALVKIENRATGFHREVMTNGLGYYVIPGLLIGVYDLTIGHAGFSSAEFKEFELVVGQTRTINAQMQIASRADEVRVEAEAPALEQSAATVGGLLERRAVAELPVNGRAWTALMALVPGAIDNGAGTQKSIRFAGRGVDDNNYRFDGLDATGISNQGGNANFRLQISTEAIAEFKVDTALYGAETGGTFGGQMEVISKSGSNSFHGNAFEYIRNNVVSSRGPFDPSTLPPLRLNQYGASAGGPIIKNRTFFFVAYEGLQQRAHSTLIGNVPSDSFRVQVLAQSPVLAPIVNAFPVGNRAFSANVSQYVGTGLVSSGENSALIRVDHRFSDQTNFFARYNFDVVSLQSPSGALLDTALTDAKPMNGTLNLSHVFSVTMLDVLSLGVNRIHAVNATDSHFFDTSQVFVSVQIPGFEKLNQKANSVSSPTTYSLKDDFTWSRGAHTIKAGAEIKRVAYNSSTASESGLVFSSLAKFAANKLDTVNLIGGTPMLGLLKTEYFGYVQDAWKLRPNLTLNAGLRYEFFNAFHELHGRDHPFDLQSCGGYCPLGSAFDFPQPDNFEPRLSVAWTPEFLGGRTVIRSGSGLYKGEGQLGDLTGPTANYTQRSALSIAQFPNLSYPADQYYPLAGTVAVAPRGLIRHRHDPTALQWGLQVQTALPAGFVLDTGYLGYHAYHQYARSYVNMIDPVTGTRPLPAFGPIDVKGTDGNAHFHAWQTSLQRRFRSGLSLAANYMWSHAINDGASGSDADYPQNTLCRSCDTASGTFDVRHVLSATSVYELPFGKGRRYLHSGGVGNFLAGGWQLSGIFSARSGNPVNVIIDRDASVVPGGLSIQDRATWTRPDYVSGVSIVPAHQTINNWINAAAFSVPAAGTWGNVGRNIARGPKFSQLNLALSKDFHLTERALLEFRTEAFNALNRAQFGDPNRDWSSPSFGQITTTVNAGSATGSGTPREFQFSLRVKF
jgi:hypothetical protein